MSGGLKKHLEEAAERRVEELGILLLKNDNTYKELRTREYEVQQILMTTLTEEQQGMLVELEGLHSSQESIARDRIYRDGFMDGVKLVRLLLK
jgi:flagellar basal body-associated protein FliL